MRQLVVLLLLGGWVGLAWGLPGDRLQILPSPSRTPTGLTFDGKRLWIADHALDELLQVDTQTGAVIKRLPSPGYRPAGLAFDGQALWAVDTAEPKLYRIQPGDGLVVRTIPSPVTAPRALAWDGKALWVSDDASKAIHQVDPLDGTTIREIPFPKDSVDALAFDGVYLWVADRLADELYVVHPPTGEVLMIVKAPGPHTTGLAWTGQDLWTVDYQEDQLVRIRRQDNQWLAKGTPRESFVVFTQEVHNHGPDRLPKVDLFLAVPKNEESQQLLGKIAWEPKPNAIETDQWGQSVAHFVFENVQNNQRAEARLKARVRAFPLAYQIFPEQVGSLDQIPKDIRTRYLEDNPKYDLKNPIIQKAVAESVGAEKNPYWIARKITRYIHDKLLYEMIGGWDVAPKVLGRGSGSCSEYSFVFIAMARAVGLPTRFAGALVVRKDAASYDDVYHRWVEVYLPPFGWVPIDPSRGDKPKEAERADSFGRLTADFLITTHGGGGSKLLDWQYNYQEQHTCAGRCKVVLDGMAIWSPEDPDQPFPGKEAASPTGDPTPEFQAPSCKPGS